MPIPIFTDLKIYLLFRRPNGGAKPQKTQRQVTCINQPWIYTDATDPTKTLRVFCRFERFVGLRRPAIIV
jgi:hypothetical protein